MVKQQQPPIHSAMLLEKHIFSFIPIKKKKKRIYWME
jgi:hypothetical protein